MIRFVYLIIVSLVFVSAANSLEQAETTLNLELETIISVAAEDSIITKDHSGNSDIDFTAVFTVQANTKQVGVYVETTDFYLDGDTANPEVERIGLHESTGVSIEPDGAVLKSGANPAEYVAEGDPVGSFPTLKTETLTFESPDNMFDHSTAVTVTWEQDDPFKPAGTYVAKIRLTCLIIPQ